MAARKTPKFYAPADFLVTTMNVKGIKTKQTNAMRAARAVKRRRKTILSLEQIRLNVQNEKAEAARQETGNQK